MPYNIDMEVSWLDFGETQSALVERLLHRVVLSVRQIVGLETIVLHIPGDAVREGLGYLKTKLMMHNTSDQEWVLTPKSLSSRCSGTKISSWYCRYGLDDIWVNQASQGGRYGEIRLGAYAMLMSNSHNHVVHVSV